VLLLDEPFSAVDQVTRRRLQRELAQMRQRLQIPIVLVTHDLEEAAALADRMVVLHRGATLQEGPPLEVLAKPRNALVARLVDFRNLFHGIVAAQEPGRTVIEWEGHPLEALPAPDFAPGTRVCWGVLPAHCILHRRDRPSRGERENPVRGTIGEYLPFGENASVTLWVGGRREIELRFAVPAHVAARNRLAEGIEATVSLLQAGVHLMPYEPLDRPAYAGALTEPAAAATIQT
jgi:molybdate transport system ATP-binding protein